MDAAARARALIGGRVDGTLDGARLHEVLLATTELVTNAVRHGGSDAAGELTLSFEIGDKVRVAVSDAGAAKDAPHVRELDPETPGGLGLFIVEQLSDEWGVERAADRTTVWFEMSVAAPRSRAA